MAAAPESPELSVESIKATEATFHAVINPNITEPVEGGTYHFLYKAGASCVGGTETTPGVYGGGGPETFTEAVTGLTANTEYAVCLVVEASGGGSAEAATTFKTALPPEAPVTLSPAQEITATTAKLEGTLNPHVTAKDGWYFAYSNPGGASCLEGPNTGQEPEVQGEALPEHKTVENLQPHQKYVFCMVAINSAGETAAGNEVPFETLPAPASIESESASNIKSSEATLEGSVNPNNQLTECHFSYGISTVAENTVPCTPELLKGFGGQSVAPNPQPLTGLTPGANTNTTSTRRTAKAKNPPATEDLQDRRRTGKAAR